MRSRLSSVVIAFGLAGVGACASKPPLDPLPANIEIAKAPAQTVKMTAHKWSFEPAEIHVKAGTLSTIEVTSIEGTHGLAIPDYAIDELLEEGEPKTIRVYLAGRGEHPFKCSHFCGVGHLGMRGRIVVE